MDDNSFLHELNFFEKNIFDRLKKNVIDFLDNDDTVKYSDELGRYYGLIFLPDDIKDIIIKNARKYLNDDSLDIVYCQAVKYQINGNSIPSLKKHKDNLNCKYTVDILIESTVEWPLVIEDVEVFLKENSAILMNGSVLSHKREAFPSNNKYDYVILLFAHLSPESDPIIEASRRFFSMPKDVLRKIQKNSTITITGGGMGRAK